MSFQSPAWLWALVILVPLTLGLAAWLRAGIRAGRIWSDPAVMAVGPSARARRWRAAAAAATLLAVACGVVAMARPSMDATSDERRSTVMIALDVSDSMKKVDLEPSRLAAAVDAAGRFAAAAPEQTAIGVTTFADNAVVRVAPTTDRDRVRQALQGVGETRVGTALGVAITTSLSALDAAGAVAETPPADPSDSPARILLLTDGANSIRRATSPEAAAERAAQAGVPIYTVLLGDDKGRPDQPLPAETLSAMSTRTRRGLRAEHDVGRPARRLHRHRVDRRAGADGARAHRVGGRRRHRPPRPGGAARRPRPSERAPPDGRAECLIRVDLELKPRLQRCRRRLS